jgi:putative endonuclease
MNDRHYYVYILSNKYHTVYYIGVTNNIVKRVFEHKHKLADSFTKKYNISELLYFEDYSDIKEALNREKQIKDYRRSKKLSLIEKLNPGYKDLYDEISR